MACVMVNGRIVMNERRGDEMSKLPSCVERRVNYANV